MSATNIQPKSGHQSLTPKLPPFQFASLAVDSGLVRNKCRHGPFFSSPFPLLPPLQPKSFPYRDPLALE